MDTAQNALGRIKASGSAILCSAIPGGYERKSLRPWSLTAGLGDRIGDRIKDVMESFIP